MAKVHTSAIISSSRQSSISRSCNMCMKNSRAISRCVERSEKAKYLKAQLATQLRSCLGSFTMRQVVSMLSRCLFSARSIDRVSSCCSSTAAGCHATLGCFFLTTYCTKLETVSNWLRACPNAPPSATDNIRFSNTRLVFVLLWHRMYNVL